MSGLSKAEHRHILYIVLHTEVYDEGIGRSDGSWWLKEGEGVNQGIQ